MDSTSLRSLILNRGYAIARDDDKDAGTHMTNIWVTLGVIVGVVAVCSIILFFVVVALNRRRKNNKTKLPYVIKNPREWYRRHNSVREILEDEELARITQIRKSLQGRTSSRNSQSSHTTTNTTTTMSTTTGESAVSGPSTAEYSILEDAEVLREDSKVWEHRMQSSPPTSTRDLEAQGHPAFSPPPTTALPLPPPPGESSRTPTDENGLRLPERKQLPRPRRNTVGTPQPPSPARIAGKEARRTRSRPSGSLPPPYEPQEWPLKN
ncbi:hypothetical protein MGN70_014752 [Eutypa lata]|nr:hypothetical protein MGN70_014752 [Eutypa lata]